MVGLVSCKQATVRRQPPLAQVNYTELFRVPTSLLLELRAGHSTITLRTPYSELQCSEHHCSELCAPCSVLRAPCSAVCIQVEFMSKMLKPCCDSASISHFQFLYIPHFVSLIHVL